jgi:hypothetical protein
MAEIGSKSLGELVNEAVELGASGEDLRSTLGTQADEHVGEVQYGEKADTPVEDEFKDDPPTPVAEGPTGRYAPGLQPLLAPQEATFGDVPAPIVYDELAASEPEPVPEGPITPAELEAVEAPVEEEPETAPQPLEFDTPAKRPAFVESFSRDADEMNMFGNMYRVVRDTFEQATATDEDEQEVGRNRETLLDGVHPDYHEYVMGMPSLKAAERAQAVSKVKHVRRKGRSEEPWYQSLGSGITAFLVDPTNLIPGLVVVKGINVMSKLTIGLGLRIASKAPTAAKIAKIGAAGTLEEGLRNAPRLATDVDYQVSDYFTDMALGLAIGSAIPGVPALKGAMPNWRMKLADTAQATGLDAAVRNSYYKASGAMRAVGRAEGGLIQKIRTADYGQAIKDARIKTNDWVSNQVREVRKIEVQAPIVKAMETLDPRQATTPIVQAFDTVVASIKARTKDPEINAKVDAARKSLEDAPEPTVTAPDASPKGKVQAAKETVKETVEEVAEKAHVAAKATKAKARKAQDAALKLVDESDLPDAAKRELRWALERLKDDTDDAVDKALRSRGLEPRRTRMNNKEHTEAVTTSLFNMRKAAASIIGKIGKGLPSTISLPKRVNHILNRAFEDAGINKLDGKTWSESLQAQIKRLTINQRAAKVQQISDSFQNRMQRLKGELDAHPGVDVATSERIAMEIDEAMEAVAQQINLAETIANNPYQDVILSKTKWTAISNSWREQGDMAELKKQFTDSWTQNIVRSQFGGLTFSLSSRLMSSGSPLAQWYTSNILETPSGFGGKLDRNPLTAAILSETMDNRATQPVFQAWDNFVQAYGAENGWSYYQSVTNAKGHPRTHPDVREMSQAVQREVNARQMGNPSPSTSSTSVKKMADELIDGYSRLHDLQVGWVDGMHAGNKIDNYQHHKWSDDQIVALLGTDNGRRDLGNLFAAGYEKAGLPHDKAVLLGKATVEQKAAAAARPKTNQMTFDHEMVQNEMPELKAILARLRKDGTPQETIQEIVEHLNASTKGDLPGYAKSRISVDLSAEADVGGVRMQLVDLLDNDIPGTFAKYSKEATARRAMSESSGGAIKSDTDMKQLLTAMELEAQELGANVNTRAVYNSMMMLMGKQYDGQLPMDVRRIRDATALAGMGGLGESQLAEFGMALNRGVSGIMGAAMKVKHEAAMGNQKLRGLSLSPEQMQDAGLLNDLQELSGLFGNMHLIEPRNIHFDQINSDTSALSSVVDTMTGGKFRPLLQHWQTRFTGYGVIRQWEDQIAMTGLMMDIGKHFTGRKAFTSMDRFRDIGVDTSPNGFLGKKFSDGTIEVDADGKVLELNLHRWSEKDKNMLGVILNRHASQVVQKSFVGELSPGMMNPWVSFMMQFKSYAMTAAEKQQGRNLKMADKEAVMGMVLNGASSAGARAIRYYSMAAALPEADREAYLEEKFGQWSEFGFDTMAYMGNAGMFPQIWEAGKGMATGEKGVEDQLPALNFASAYLKAIRGVGDGEITDQDIRNTQVAAPLGTMAAGNIAVGALRNWLD